VSTFAFVIETDPTPEHIQYLEDRLCEFNSAATGITDGQGLAIFVRDAQDRIVAGICGHTWGGCCEIRQLWVEESRRGQGLGTRLLQAAEQEARCRHCRQMVLTTFDFQAPEFYT
jgi:GNAT superfamily N-acetyltransferase